MTAVDVVEEEVTTVVGDNDQCSVGGGEVDNTINHSQ
jgi:hypothetical protein